MNACQTNATTPESGPWPGKPDIYTISDTALGRILEIAQQKLRPNRDVPETAADDTRLYDDVVKEIQDYVTVSEVTGAFIVKVAAQTPLPR